MTPSSAVKPTYGIDVDSASPLAPEPWTFLRRITFRFAFVYLILYCWPEAGRSSLLDAIPALGPGSANDSDTQILTRWLEAPSHALNTWVATHIFHLTGAVTRYHVTGSGDTTLDYIQVFCFAVIAIIAAAIWSILDRRRQNYRTLYAWLRLVVRFTLSFTLLSYGFAKVFPLQFIPPGLSRLTETYGDSSPMGLLWTFMGASTAYTVLCGLVEAAGGVLLFFRRTTALGALVGGVAMLNIAALNFCYDVPVKLYSVHLFLMCVFLLLPDFAALWSFFALHRASRLVGVWLPRFERRPLRIAAIALQVLVIVSVLYNNIWGGYRNAKSFAAEFKHPPLYGVWTVDGGDSHWRQIVIDAAMFLTVRTDTGESLGFRTTYDSAKHRIDLSNRRTKHSGELTFERPDEQHLMLRGKLDEKPVVIQLHRNNPNQFLLTSRGFHWITEDSFNR